MTLTASPLAQPLDVAGVRIPNRVMQTAHSKLFSDRVESDRETAYFVRRAQGGCGLVVAGNHFVHPSSSIRFFQDAFRPESVEAGRRFTDAIREAGARVFVQLNHHGAQAYPEGPDGPRAIYAPSRILSPSHGHATKEASREELRAFAEGWAISAAHAREAGFDGVEVHMAHGYLLHQFLSPLYNARRDEYGGDLEGRTRFPREVLAAVRAAVGDDYPVGIRIVANEHNPAGLDAAAMRGTIARLRAEHRIDFLDLAAGGYHDVHWVFPSSPMPVAWLRDDAAAVKAANPDVPVFAVGAALAVEEAAEVVASGIADMVALTRGQIADPDLAVKLREGRTDEIRHCIRLNQGCLGRTATGAPMSCTVNPSAGRELLRGPRAAASAPQRWLVVGGGPAGMRAAVELAADGHAVTLYESAARLGGQLRLARRVPGRESVGLLIADLERDLRSAGVEVRLGTTADARALAAEAADGIVLATGARAPRGTSLALGGAIPGGFTDGRAVDAFTALADPAALGRRIAVADTDGTAYASGVVLSLLAHVDELEYVTAAETAFPHVGAGYVRPILLEQLAAHPGFRRRAAHEVTGSGDDALEIRDVLTGEVGRLAGLDAIVALEPRAAVALPGLADPDAVAFGATRVVRIGDALTPRGIDAAIAEAVETAYAAAGLADWP